MSEIHELRKEVQELKEIILKLNQTCSRMDNHIDFVETVYASIRLPLEYIRKRLSFLTEESQVTSLVEYHPVYDAC